MVQVRLLADVGVLGEGAWVDVTELRALELVAVGLAERLTPAPATHAPWPRLHIPGPTRDAIEGEMHP